MHAYRPPQRTCQPQAETEHEAANEYGDQPQGRLARVACMGGAKQYGHDQGRPPEIEAARKRVKQVPPKEAFLDERHDESLHRPQRRVPPYGPTAQQLPVEGQQMARPERPYHRGYRQETDRPPGEESSRHLAIGQAITPYRALLDLRHHPCGYEDRKGQRAFLQNPDARRLYLLVVAVREE